MLQLSLTHAGSQGSTAQGSSSTNWAEAAFWVIIATYITMVILAVVFLLRQRRIAQASASVDLQRSYTRADYELSRQPTSHNHEPFVCCWLFDKSGYVLQELVKQSTPPPVAAQAQPPEVAIVDLTCWHPRSAEQGRHVGVKPTRYPSQQHAKTK